MLEFTHRESYKQISNKKSMKSLKNLHSLKLIACIAPEMDDWNTIFSFWAWPIFRG